MDDAVAITLARFILYFYVFRSVVLTWLHLPFNCDFNLIASTPFQVYAIASFYGSVKALNGIKNRSFRCLRWILVDNALCVCFHIGSMVKSILVSTSFKEFNESFYRHLLYHNVMVISIHSLVFLTFKLLHDKIRRDNEKCRMNRCDDSKKRDESFHTKIQVHCTQERKTFDVRDTDATLSPRYVPFEEDLYEHFMNRRSQ